MEDIKKISRREFINKKDRDGKKIREGDIMKCPSLIGWEHANRNGIVEEWGAEYRIHTQNGLEPKEYFEKSIIIGSIYNKNYKDLLK